jgi:hypothetical protein
MLQAAGILWHFRCVTHLYVQNIIEVSFLLQYKCATQQAMPFVQELVQKNLSHFNLKSVT